MLALGEDLANAVSVSTLHYYRDWPDDTRWSAERKMRVI